MRQRIAITISSLVAAAVLAVGLTAAGFGPEPRSALGEEADLAATDATLAIAETEDPTEPEIIYVKPAPKAKTVVVKKRVKQQRASNAGSTGNRQVRATRYDDDDDDRAEHRREHERESAKERREERREREHEDDDD
jgi:hypothetical protein